MPSKPKRKLAPKKKMPPKRGAVSTKKVTQEVDLNKEYTLYTDANVRGKKIIVYGVSGMGKSTLCAMLSEVGLNPVFLALDDGVDELVHPATGQPLNRYKANSYQDVRNILAQGQKLFLDAGFDTVIVDTMTAVEEYAVPFILDTVLKDGVRMKNLEQYGYSKGYAHLSDHDNYIKYDLQKLCEMGLNVVVICQQAPIKRSEAGVDDYFKDTPKLTYRPTVGATAALDFVEWSDHCLRS